ncbi:helix-turn-helix domain-containing protein [Aneurinibacillus terranovensis]|uniref:helix-turn-helix domain-containing protein n=1 Tax=Aneurinibacillus terranovensis TaxID=278991 RepID=UPI0003FAA59B|nr:helix-turn-helix domain-containing protein [Aneurinibacillus terranovensis]
MIDILTNKKISVAERLLLLYLQEKQENGVVNKEKKEIAQELGIRRETVIRYVAELQEHGFIREERDYTNKPSKIRILKEVKR